MKYFHQSHEYMSTNCSLKIGRSHEPTSHFDMHWHNSIEIVYGYKSSYTVTVGTTEYKMESGDILFIPSRSLHSFSKQNQPDPLFFIIFKAEPIYSGGDIYRGRYDTEMFNPLIKSTVQIKSTDTPQLHSELKASIESLLEIMVNQPDGFRYLGISKLYEIIGILYKYKIAGQTLDDTLPDEQMDNIIKSFIYIEEHFNENISVNDIASLCGYSPKYFGRLFFKVTGSYFNDFLNDLRVTKATEMMLSKDTHITDIAYNCGFSCAATFYRAFSKKYGCTPKQFIEKYNL